MIPNMVIERRLVFRMNLLDSYKLFIALFTNNLESIWKMEERLKNLETNLTEDPYKLFMAYLHLISFLVLLINKTYHF